MTSKRGMASLVWGGILTGLFVGVALFVLFALWADVMLFIDGVFSEGHDSCLAAAWDSGYTI